MTSGPASLRVFWGMPTMIDWVLWFDLGTIVGLSIHGRRADESWLNPGKMRQDGDGGRYWLGKDRNSQRMKRSRAIMQVRVPPMNTE